MSRPENHGTYGEKEPHGLPRDGLGQSLNDVPIVPVPLVATLALHIERYQSRLAVLDDTIDLATFVREERATLIARILAQFRNDPSHVKSDPDADMGTGISREFSDLIDCVIRRMFQMACAAAGSNPFTLPLAIVATGGYGRRELAPFSDIDITFIPLRDGEPTTDRVVRELFRFVMDVFIAKCGLEVGYAYRLLSDCTSLDHQTASGLLDARQIAGSERLFIQFEDAFWNGFNATEFIFTKIDERNAILGKWGSLPRCVEPHLKEGAGGLRDIHSAVWLVQAREHLAAARVRGNRGLSVLCREAGFSEADLISLTGAKERLLQVRNALHAVCGAERDQLVVTRQEEVASVLGFTASVRDGTPAVEQFMSRLFPALGLWRYCSERVMRTVGASRLMLGIGLDCENREIVSANGALSTVDPVWLVWACDLAQRYALQLSDGIQTTAMTLIQAGAATKHPEEVADALTEILSRLGHVYPIMQKMADLGILAWILPEFCGLMDLIPYDASHDFTVGQHTLLVIRNIESLLSDTADSAEEVAEMRRALKELPHPEYLMLAAVLHDTGKSTPGRPHAEQSAMVVDSVCRRLQWSDEAAGHVRFLVSNHLLMGDTSRLKDLTMEKTIRDFVTIVDDGDRLNMLYLLTYADTTAVGEGIWTAVKGRFLRELWQRATAAIYDNEPALCSADSVADVRRKIKRDLSLEKIDSAEIEEHIEAMPPYYLLNSTQSEVALHLNFIKQARRGDIVLDFHDEREANYTEVTICTMDDRTPGLLAKIAAAMLASSLSVYSARVVTRTTVRDRIALDTLLVDYKGRPLSAGKRQELSTNLRAVLIGMKSIEDLLPRETSRSANGVNGRHAALPQRPIEIDLVSQDFNDDISVVEISGATALDLFYRVCAAVSAMDWNIQSAKLSATRDIMHSTLYLTGARHQTEAELKRRLARSLDRIVTTRR